MGTSHRYSGDVLRRLDERLNACGRLELRERLRAAHGADPARGVAEHVDKLGGALVVAHDHELLGARIARGRLDVARALDAHLERDRLEVLCSEVHARRKDQKGPEGIGKDQKGSRGIRMDQERDRDNLGRGAQEEQGEAAEDSASSNTCSRQRMRALEVSTS